jgi:hypothetical protein
MCACSSLALGERSGAGRLEGRGVSRRHGAAETMCACSSFEL